MWTHYAAARNTPGGEILPGVFRCGCFHNAKTHQHRYCDEFSFRWNERKTTDAERTLKALNLIQGARLMYKEPFRRGA